MQPTALIDAHREADARLVDFHGWEMPVQYEGILDEVRRVREHGGLFDLCHMGRLVVTGPDREALVERVFSAELSRLKVGRAKYGFLLDEQGHPIDDVLVYRDEDAVHIVINATGRPTDGPWVARHQQEGGFDAVVEDVSDAQAMIALQGPASEAVLQPLCGADLSAVRYYAFTHAPVADVTCLIARTGYTGEDGFELFFPREHARSMWDLLLGSGRALEVRPIGLGARDTLRLEAGMPLYGQEIGKHIDPIEADLAFGVALDREDKIGIPALAARHADGPDRIAISLAADRGRVARTGATLHDGDAEVGQVTSGTYSPTLDKPIARGIVRRDLAEVGRTIDVDIRGRRHPFEIVPSPFYRRQR